MLVDCPAIMTDSEHLSSKRRLGSYMGGLPEPAIAVAD